MACFGDFGLRLFPLLRFFCELPPTSSAHLIKRTSKEFLLPAIILA